MNNFKLELINGVFYNCITFDTVDQANEFLEKNPSFGVIQEKNNKIYVALIADKGLKLGKHDFICDNCDKIHTKTAYAIAQTAMNNELIFTCNCGYKIVF